MVIETIVSTMAKSKEQVLDLIHVMNLRTDAVIINQCDNNEYYEFEIGRNKMRVYSFDEKGVGKSRNTGLLRTDTDTEICLIADDDMIYEDQYVEIIKNEFKKNPKADVILFNVIIENENGEKQIKIHKNQRIRLFNCLKFGAVNIAFRKESITKKNIFFDLNFGGGAIYSCGEDTLFLTDCLKKGLKIYSSNKTIASINYRKSSWFNGYNQKYFFDKGVLYSRISRKYKYILAANFLVRRRKLYKGKYPFLSALINMNKGMNEK